jgi:membrane protein implicated in regulation of membrane protease activity
MPMNDLLDSKLYPGKGVVDSVVEPGVEWVVRLNGVYWAAQAAAGQRFQAGDTVRPVARRGNTLIIALAQGQ